MASYIFLLIMRRTLSAPRNDTFYKKKLTPAWSGAKPSRSDRGLPSRGTTVCKTKLVLLLFNSYQRQVIVLWVFQNTFVVDKARLVWNVRMVHAIVAVLQEMLA